MQCPTNAQSLGSNVGSDTKPIKIVNGQAVAVTNTLVDTTSDQVIGGYKTFAKNIQTRSVNAIGTADYPYSVVQNDKNDAFLYGMRCAVATNGKVDPYITARNADASTRDISIISHTPVSLTFTRENTQHIMYGNIQAWRSGNVVLITFTDVIVATAGLNGINFLTGLPNSVAPAQTDLWDWNSGGRMFIRMMGTTLQAWTVVTSSSGSAINGQLVYITDQ